MDRGWRVKEMPEKALRASVKEFVRE